MRFSVPQLSHTFLRLVLFVVIATTLLTPLAAVFAQGGGADSGQAGNPVVNWDSNDPLDPNSWINNPPGGGIGGYVTTNPDGSVTVTNPTTGQTETTPPNPAGISGEQINAAIAAGNAVQLEESHGLLVTIGGWVAGLGGNTFELSFTNFALKMGCYFVASGEGCSGAGLLVTNGSVGGVVNVLWEVIRDLVNIAIIFSLVYIGFMLIVNGDDSGAKKALGGIIMAALLVNFSLYIAKVVVDLSNFATVEIYEAMSTAGNGGFGVTGENSDGDLLLDSQRNGSNLASHFMTVLRISTMYSTNPDDGNSLSFAILAMFFLVFLGAIFLYGAIMMMARFIAIIVLLIFSPVMFLGLVLPNFKGISSDWRKKFVGYCLFAPAFTFMIYISLYTLIQMAPSTGGYGEAFNADGADAAAAMPIYLYFFVGAGLLFMSTKVAGTVASGSGSFLTKTADGWAKKIGYGAAGALATIPTGLAGRAMTTTSDAIERKTGRSTMLSRGLNYSGTGLKNQKVGGVSAAGMTSSAVKFVQGKERIEAGDKRARGLYDESQKEEKLKKALATLQDANATQDQRQRAVIDLKSNVTALMKEQGGVEALRKNAEFLRPDQVKALEDDKELNKEDVKTVLSTRSSTIKNQYTGTNPQKKIRDAQTPELSIFDVSDLVKDDIAIQLSEDQIKKLPEPKFIDSDKDKIKAARKNALIKVVSTGATIGGVSSADLAKMKAEDIAALPDAVFDGQNGTNSNVAAFVNQIKLSKMATIQNKKSDDVTKNIRQILDKNQAGDVVDWLNNDRIGKNFGK